MPIFFTAPSLLLVERWLANNTGGTQRQRPTIAYHRQLTHSIIFLINSFETFKRHLRMITGPVIIAADVEPELQCKRINYANVSHC